MLDEVVKTGCHPHHPKPQPTTPLGPLKQCLLGLLVERQGVGVFPGLCDLSRAQKMDQFEVPALRFYASAGPTTMGVSGTLVAFLPGRPHETTTNIIHSMAIIALYLYLDIASLQ